MTDEIFLERISDKIYTESVSFLRNEYHFLNGAEDGGRMRLANYFVGISQRLADEFIAFINHVVAQTKNNNFPEITLPEGFASQFANNKNTSWDDFISIYQSKVNYQIFKTDDGLEKIVELRFMTAYTQQSTNIVPMARIGHCVKQGDGSMVYKIHFVDNNRFGYGFAPVLIFSPV
ncbi:MAG TPA: hypothetical protein DCF68_16400 [Cyanothece sp. UBA12306]|nr:hypothetical protein [Cyanothece sp. UBA12306]